MSTDNAELRSAGCAGAHKVRKGGSITFIGGGNGSKPAGKGNHQAAAVNAATEGLGRALAVELSPTRVNVVSPGIVNTALWEHVRTCLDMA